MKVKIVFLVLKKGILGIMNGNLEQNGNGDLTPREKRNFFDLSVLMWY
jgi:hypothetical protein